MNELWVARDRDGQLWLFDAKPTWAADISAFDMGLGTTFSLRMASHLYLDLGLGECRRLVMAEVSE